MLWITLCMILPPTLSEVIKSSCHIQPVEDGDNATLTVIFGEDLSWKTSIAFSVYHFSHNSLKELQMLSCHFSSGHVECEDQTCCTPDKNVTNVFRVVIHNVSQEHEGLFWGFVNPSDMSIQRSCNFTLRAPTCSIDDITAENNHVNCTVQPVTIGHSCMVTCDKSYILEDNHASIAYTCTGKNTWSPKFPALVCKETPEEWGKDKLFLLFLLLIFIPVSIVVCIWKRQSSCDKVSKRCWSSSCRWNSNTADTTPTSHHNGNDGDAWATFERACEMELIDEIKNMLPTLMDLKDKSGLTPLMYASKKDKKNVVNLLINNGADVNITFSKKKWTALHLACQYGYKDVAEMLISKSASVVFAVTDDESTPLHLACENEHTDVVKLLVEAGANVNSVNDNNLTPLDLVGTKQRTTMEHIMFPNGSNQNSELIPLV